MWQRPAVILIGPVNTGKSTLFNTLGDKRRAVTSLVPGTTRDINVCAVAWNRQQFSLLDSAGVDVDVEPVIDRLALEFLDRALKHVDLLLFVFDGKLPRPANAQHIIQKYARKLHLRSLLVLNKIDSPTIAQTIDPAWYQLGLPGPFLVSALKGRGTGDLLDHIVGLFSTSRPSQSSHHMPTASVLLLGKPNVGKSSLFNALIGHERSLVSPLPHTTRDWQEMIIPFHDIRIRFIDTAGLRRKARLHYALESKNDPHAAIEQKTVRGTLALLKQVDVLLFVLDVDASLTQQDIALARLIEKNKKAVAIIVNKWDLVRQKNPQSPKQFEQIVRSHIPFLFWVPIIFVSAVKKQRVNAIKETAVAVYNNFRRTIPNDALSQFLVQRRNERDVRRIIYLKQVASSPPSFVLVHRYGKPVSSATIDWLRRELSTTFSLFGAPIEISTKSLRR